MRIKLLQSKTVFTNCKILDPIKEKVFKGNIFIVDGKIYKIQTESEIDESFKKVDCRGLVLTHGFCDLHSHFREPGANDKESLKSGAMAALSGGYTRVCMMPNTSPVIDNPEIIESLESKYKKLPIQLNVIAAISIGQKGQELTEMALLKKAGSVAFSDDGIPVQDPSLMRRALEYSSMFDVPIINHAEDIYLRDGGLMNESEISNSLGLSGNPNIAESLMVHRDLVLAEFTDAKLHIPHVSTSESVKYIQKAKETYSKISAEVTPHHLFFNDNALIDFDTNYKVAPPIRAEKDRLCLIRALKDGVIDCISTDHAPHKIEEKETTFDIAACGMIGLESSFGAVNKVLVKENNFNLIELIQKMTVNPRAIMGFDTDLFKVGSDAELVLLDPEEVWTFNSGDIKSMSSNSPFLGKELVGKVKKTISKGYLVDLD